MKNNRSKLIVFIIAVWCIGFLFQIPINAGNKNDNETKRITIMGLGDSITEGSDYFHSYLYELWKRLYAAGYQFEFIGPRAQKNCIGVIKHCGFSGKSAEFLDSKIDSIYRQYPADVVLLHSGHNHFAKEQPINGIINAQKSIIHKIHAINPEAKIIVAQVIQSGKLPKYSYIPELNKQIKLMVKQIHNPNVVLVDQSKHFDWKKHSIKDKVHPNYEGAEQMAKVWYKKLIKILPTPAISYKPEVVNYKTIEHGNLSLHIFKPQKKRSEEMKPAIVFFFAGGWKSGSPLQFYRECAYYASKGMVAISVDYRIASVHHSSPYDSFKDAKDAICWIRRNAAKYNIDVNKIVAAGASAGGHLAAATGTIKTQGERFADSCSKPNLLVLYYPVIDNSKEGYRPDDLQKPYEDISPLHNINPDTPPALFILGTKDPYIPVKTAKKFQEEMEVNGVECQLNLIEGAGHPIFYYRKALTPEYYKIQQLTDDFLRKHGYLQ